MHFLQQKHKVAHTNKWSFSPSATHKIPLTVSFSPTHTQSLRTHMHATVQTNEHNQTTGSKLQRMRIFMNT